MARGFKKDSPYLSYLVFGKSNNSSSPSASSSSSSEDEAEKEKKRKYRAIINQLLKINSKVVALESSVLSLKQTMRDNALIDDKTIREEEVDNAKETLSDVSSEIMNNIIPSLRSKL